MPIDKERQRIRKAQYYQENREKALAYSKQRWATQKERCQQIQKESNTRHPETKANYNHNYYLKKKEKLLGDNKKYRQENKERLRLKKNEWNKNNPELRAKYTKDNTEKYPEKALQRQVRYLKRNSMTFGMNPIEYKTALRSWKEAIKKRDVNCVVCGSDKNLEAHHILHRKYFEQLTFNLNNGILLCAECHYKAHGKKLTR